MAIHELTAFDRMQARAKHPNAAIIRHEKDVSYVFDSTAEALGHKTARVDPNYHRAA